MGFFDFISDIFAPVSKTVDDLHFSGEEKAQWEAKKSELKNQLAEIEAKTATKMMELEMKAIELSSKMAVAEQQYGNDFTKNVRPGISVGCFILIILMAFDIVPKDPDLQKMCFGWLGFYGGLRSFIDKKK